MPSLADKYAVRKYVAGKIGHEFLNDLYGVWDDPPVIPFEALPESFVLKVTWGVGEKYFVSGQIQTRCPDNASAISQMDEAKRVLGVTRMGLQTHHSSSRRSRHKPCHGLLYSQTLVRCHTFLMNECEGTPTSSTASVLPQYTQGSVPA